MPSEASLSRGRLKVDILLCLSQQATMANPAEHFIFLSSDSSPQGGYELLMTLQDTCKRILIEILLTFCLQCSSRSVYQ